jgi:hypothetical protein
MIGKCLGPDLSTSARRIRLSGGTDAEVDFVQGATGDGLCHAFFIASNLPVPSGSGPASPDLAHEADLIIRSSPYFCQQAVSPLLA